MKNNSTIDIGCIYLGERQGGGGDTQYIVVELTRPSVNSISPTSIVVEEGTSQDVALRFKVKEGTYKVAKVQLLNGGAEVNSISSPRVGTELTFNINGVSTATTYSLKVTDVEGYYTETVALNVRTGRRVYYGIVPSDHDVLTQADIDMVTEAWVKANCTSEVLTSKKFERELKFATTNGFAIISTPKTWTKSDPDQMTVQFGASMTTSYDRYRKTIKINNVDYDIYIALDRSLYNIKYGIA